MESKVILVTGASRGIGRQIAKDLACAGNIVIANYFKSDECAKSLLEEVNKSNLEIYKADVSKRAEVKNMIQYIIEKYKKIDVIINNAGISQFKLFTDITDDDWQTMINTNLYSTSPRWMTGLSSLTENGRSRRMLREKSRILFPYLTTRHILS